MLPLLPIDVPMFDNPPPEMRIVENKHPTGLFMEVAKIKTLFSIVSVLEACDSLTTIITRCTLKLFIA